MSTTCPVCGYPDLHPHALEACHICPSCDFEFGYTDDSEGISYEQWRKQWIDNGMEWNGSSSQRKPFGWNPKLQLLNIGIKI